jgi:acyl-coenzyme A thioesterase PaaI-like protein
MKLNTHLNIDTKLNGEVVELLDNYAKVKLTTNDMMIADDRGLIHGGFIFGAADFCAMATVNDPYVVLGKSEIKFLAPTFIGDVVIFESSIKEDKGSKKTVEVSGYIDNKQVFIGDFTTITLDKHIKDI